MTRLLRGCGRVPHLSTRARSVEKCEPRRVASGPGRSATVGLMPERPTHLRIDGVDVEIRRSDRRTRTVSARVEGERVVVLAPARMSARAEGEAVESLVRRVMRKRASARNDDTLMARALELSRLWVPGSPRPTSVRWVTNMTTRWGSCTVGDGSIRLSDAMVGMPQYVIDAVLLHEVAHLVEHGHGPAFRRIVEAFPEHSRAEAYLAGASFGSRRADLPKAPLSDAEATQPE